MKNKTFWKKSIGLHYKVGFWDLSMRLDEFFILPNPPFKF